MSARVQKPTKDQVLAVARDLVARGLEPNMISATVTIETTVMIAANGEPGSVYDHFHDSGDGQRRRLFRLSRTERGVLLVNLKLVG